MLANVKNGWTVNKLGDTYYLSRKRKYQPHNFTNVVELADLISGTKNAILTHIPLPFFQPKWRVHSYTIYASHRACHTPNNPGWRTYWAVILFSRSEGVGSALRLWVCAQMVNVRRGPSYQILIIITFNLQGQDLVKKLYDRKGALREHWSSFKEPWYVSCFELKP